MVELTETPSGNHHQPLLLNVFIKFEICCPTVPLRPSVLVSWHSDLCVSRGDQPILVSVGHLGH